MLDDLRKKLEALETMKQKWSYSDDDDTPCTFDDLRDNILAGIESNREELLNIKKELTTLNSLLALQIALSMDKNTISNIQTNTEQIEEAVLNLIEKQKAILNLVD